MSNLGSEFEAGMGIIGKELMRQAREAGHVLTPENVLWNRNGDGEMPGAVTLEIKLGDRSANRILSREQVEDSCERPADRCPEGQGRRPREEY